MHTGDCKCNTDGGKEGHYRVVYFVWRSSAGGRRAVGAPNGCSSRCWPLRRRFARRRPPSTDAPSSPLRPCLQPFRCSRPARCPSVRRSVRQTCPPPLLPGTSAARSLRTRATRSHGLASSARTAGVCTISASDRAAAGPPVVAAGRGPRGRAARRLAARVRLAARCTRGCARQRDRAQHPNAPPPNVDAQLATGGSGSIRAGHTPSHALHAYNSRPTHRQIPPLLAAGGVRPSRSRSARAPSMQSRASTRSTSSPTSRAASSTGSL